MNLTERFCLSSRVPEMNPQNRRRKPRCLLLPSLPPIKEIDLLTVYSIPGIKTVIRMTTKLLILIVLLLAPAIIARADTYSTFKTTRFYSANGRYFIEVTPNKHMTLYANDRT